MEHGYSMSGFWQHGNKDNAFNNSTVSGRESCNPETVHSEETIAREVTTTKCDATAIEKTMLDVRIVEIAPSSKLMLPTIVEDLLGATTYDSVSTQNLPAASGFLEEISFWSGGLNGTLEARFNLIHDGCEWSIGVVNVGTVCDVLLLENGTDFLLLENGIDRLCLES